MADKKNGKTSLREALKDMAENTTVHGIPKIVSSKSIHMKLLWLILVLGLTGYLLFSLSQLFLKFQAWPVQTTVSLEFSTLKFPAISFCNVNPIKKSKLADAPATVKDILAGRSKRSSYPNPSGSGTGSTEIATTESDTNTATTESDTNTATTESDTNTATTESDTTTATTESDTTTANTESDTTTATTESDTTTATTESDTTTATTEFDATTATTKKTTKSSTKHPLDSFITGNSSDLFWDFYKDGSGSGSGTDSGSGSKNELDEVDYSGDYKDILVEKKDGWLQRVERFKNVFSLESVESRLDLGHSIEDMLVACSFNGRECSAKDFDLFQSSEYGNCFTLDRNNFKSRKSGPSYGLWLTLNVEIPEYITNYASGYGIKLVIHEPGTYPFPSEEGVVISTGQETMIGLRAVEVNRINTPRKYCEKGKEFLEKFGINFTTEACIRLCKQQAVLDICKCMPSGMDLEVNLEGKEIVVCDIMSLQDEACQLHIDSLYNSQQLECKCESPCTETVYQKTLSARLWPNVDYLKYVLLQGMCREQSNISYIQHLCTIVNTLSTDNMPDMYKYTFLRVVIYYEDLNYEKISEELMYDSYRFISDIGGTLGLFVGASLLSFIEIIQLTVIICTHCHGRMFRTNDVKCSNAFVDESPAPNKNGPREDIYIKKHVNDKLTINDI